MQKHLLPKKQKLSNLTDCITDPNKEEKDEKIFISESIRFTLFESDLWGVTDKGPKKILQVLKCQNICLKPRIPFSCPQWLEDGGLAGDNF